MDYTKLTEITVKTQEGLDAIPDDFAGRIYIDGGTLFARIYIEKRYSLPVEARGNSSVEARGNSSVEARGNSSVVARENSSVEAWGNSSVEAWGNSSVVAWGNSSVVANANAQIVDMLQGAKIKISGNARIVHMPKNIFEFMDFHGVKHTKTKATFYKAVHKHSETLYRSDHSFEFCYEIGKNYKEFCDPNTAKDCAMGLHVATLNWALRFGSNWENLAILEVETKIEDIVMPKNTDGKVRTSALKVIREVPLEECGVYGKILARRRKA